MNRQAVEKYYSVLQVAWILEVSEKWVREQIKQGAFGQLLDADTTSTGSLADVDVVMIAGEFRIAASAINRFLRQRAYRYDDGIKARNVAEMRRKLKKDSQ